MTRQQLFTYAEAKYETKPEYLWESSPDTCILRNRNNQKWYGVFMHVERKKVGLPGNTPVDILVIKGNADEIVHMIEMPGFAPAYHMNKKHWFSVVLEAFSDEQVVTGLLDKSYQRTEKKC